MSRGAVKDFADSLRGKEGNMAGRRIVVAGKGGVGKTTLSAALCLLGNAQGKRVLAVDQDVQQNLAYSLGIDPNLASGLKPITEMLDYIEEKVGVTPGAEHGGLMTLNPDVSDVGARFGISVQEGLDLLVMGGVVHATTGCLCPENAMLGALVRHIDGKDEDLIVMDAQAGLEPFGRSVAKGFSNVLIVAEPTFNSLQVAGKVSSLAKEMGIPQIHLVINKAFDPVEIERASEILDFDSFDNVFALPFDPTVREAEPDVSRLLGGGGPYISAVEEMMGLMF